MAVTRTAAERGAAERPAASRNGHAAPYVEQFRRLYREQGAGLAVDAADAAARAVALEELSAVGFPLRHDEEWAHTPVRTAVETAYRLEGRLTATRAPAGVVAALVEDDPLALLTVNGAVTNGRLASGLLAAGMSRTGNSADSGMGTAATVAPVVRLAPRDAGSDGAAFHGSAGTAPVNAFTRPTGDAFTRLARVFGSVAELWFNADAGAAPVHLVHLTEAGVLSAPRVRIRVAAGARVTLVETFAAANGEPEEDAPALTCGDTEIHLGAGAALTYVRGAGCGRGRVRPRQHDGGAGAGQRAARAERGGRRPAGAPHPQRAGGRAGHRQPAGRCRGGRRRRCGERAAGDRQPYLPGARRPELRQPPVVQDGAGRRRPRVFSGRILVRPEAQQTDAFQLNRNLLLDDAVVDTKPQLEIGADDVRCTHGATTGRLNEDQMFYLQTRGIPRPAAGQMLARGFLDEVVGDLPAAALRPRLLALLHRRLDRLAWSAPA